MDDHDSNDDAIGAVLQTRRIPHGRSRNRQGKGYGEPGSSSIFDPLHARGRYEVSLGSNKKHARGSDTGPDSWLEIHELAAGNDALIGTFSLDGKAQGMCVLAGSRKGLAQAVRSLETMEEVRDTTTSEDHVTTNEKGEDSPYRLKSFLELDDEKRNQAMKAFEKNTFRSPKFWMTWRSSKPTTENVSTGSEIKRSAYFVFAGNSCQRFEGTISSSDLDWDNLKLRGRKLHSRVSPCPLIWSDLS